MKALYFLWWLIFGYSSRLFYRKIVVLNSKRNSEGSTIFISNHPASFMDPLIVSRFNNAIVFFLTRSDVFTKFTNPFFKSAHMLPIYRQQDGGNTNEKNKEVFKKCSDVLMKNKNILIFGEGLVLQRLNRVIGKRKFTFRLLESTIRKQIITGAIFYCLIQIKFV